MSPAAEPIGPIDNQTAIDLHVSIYLYVRHEINTDYCYHLIQSSLVTFYGITVTVTMETIVIAVSSVHVCILLNLIM